jgi:hypothetical protein
MAIARAGYVLVCNGIQYLAIAFAVKSQESAICGWYGLQVH